MENKRIWEEKVKTASEHYLNLNDGGFDENMKANLYDFNYEEKSVSYEFETQKWQINERGAIHGGAISGILDTAFGIVANFTAGPNEATTTDMTITYLRELEYGDKCIIKVYIVKAGRKLIRQRAEVTSKKTGKLVATAVGSWMPL